MLFRSHFHEKTLLGHLPHLPALVHLDIRDRVRAPRALVRALAATPTTDADTTGGLCPVLEILDVDGELNATREDARETADSRFSGTRLRVRGWVASGTVLRWEEEQAVGASV